MRWKGTSIAGIALLAAAVAGAAAAGVRAAPAPAQMTLRPAEIPGARVSGRSTKPDPGYVASYSRSFAPARPYGRSQLVSIESEVAVAPTEAVVADELARMRATLRTRDGRNRITAKIASSAGLVVSPRDVSRVAVRAPSVGDEAIELDATFTVAKAAVSVTLTLVRVDRVLSTLATAGARPAVAAEIARLGSLVVGHVAEQLAPVAASPPTIAGSAVPGQTLAARTGTWRNGPTLAYRWQRCDAAGTACADVPGTIAATYAVSSADAAATLRVTVTGTNRFGSASRQSAPTAVVPATG